MDRALAALVALTLGCAGGDFGCRDGDAYLRELNAARRTDVTVICTDEFSYVHAEALEASETFGGMIGKLIDGIIAYFGAAAAL
jgi:hypothetical protein